MTNETDRELLELAAKAAGIPYIKPPPEYSGCYGLQAGSTNPMRCQSWNPLEDDGDALRLVNRLHLRIEHHLRHPFVCVFAVKDFCLVKAEEPHGDDVDAATRLAIVRAAAEIGKAMP